MKDTTKRYDKLQFSDTHIVTAGDVTTGYYLKRFKFGECFLKNVTVYNNTRASVVDVVLSKIGEDHEFGQTLMGQEQMRGAELDIIWEGDEYVPANWELIVKVTAIVAADQIRIHGAYDI